MNTEIGVVAVVLAIAAYIDWKDHRVPNGITFTVWIFGIIFHFLIHGWSGLYLSFFGSMTGLATLILPYALGGMGAGDVKLMAAVGAWLGTAAVLHAFVWICIAGGLMGVFLIYTSGQADERIRTMIIAAKNLFSLRTLDSGVGENAPHRIDLPYGVPITIGFYAYFLFGKLV